MTLTEGQKTFEIKEIPEFVIELVALRDELNQQLRKIDEAFRDLYQFTKAVDTIADADVTALRMYKTIETDGTSIVADSNADTAKIAGGTGVTTSGLADVITVTIGQDVATSASPTFSGLTVVNAITEFSTDDTLGDDSDSALPTEKAVKGYVDTQVAGVVGESFHPFMASGW
jgi:hypothetical protein